MANVQMPELNSYMFKKISVKLNAERVVIGTLTGFDAFMNLVLDDAEEVHKDGSKQYIGSAVIRGSSVMALEALE